MARSVVLEVIGLRTRTLVDQRWNCYLVHVAELGICLSNHVSRTMIVTCRWY